MTDSTHCRPLPLAGVSEHDLKRMDRLAEGILRLIDPLQIELARTPRDLECAYRLRFQTARDRGWISPEQFPSGREQDEHDDSALQIVAIEGDAVVGTARIILPAPGRRLPAERMFTWNADDRGCMVEVGRICRDPHSTSGPRVFFGLIGKVWIEMRKRNFTVCCGVADINMIHVYEDVGFDVVRMAPPRLHWGEERWPVVIRPVNSRRTAA